MPITRDGTKRPREPLLQLSIVTGCAMCRIVRRQRVGYASSRGVVVEILTFVHLVSNSRCEDPLSRSYGVSLPSSLTVNLPSALVYSTRLRVSVCGTGTLAVELSGFSRESGYLHYHSARRLCVLSSSAQMVDLPAILITYTLQRGLPSPRGGFTAPSPRRPMRQ